MPSKALLLEAKKHGFSDEQIAHITGLDEDRIYAARHRLGMFPCTKQIDTLAAEYPAQTNYLYLTYNGTEDDIIYDDSKSVIVLGSGSYRIGSSVEFDWCCMNAVRTLRNLGYAPIMINYNPETVSTDYDECNRLYFDELSFETVRDIYRKENPLGLLVSVGGQIPNTLAIKCHQAGMQILGSSPESIDGAEDRHKFSKLLDDLRIDQPKWEELASLQDALSFAQNVGYPVLVRPSYVLSGAAMSVALNDNELVKFLEKASDVSSEHPIVISKFLENAKEVEIDAVARDGEIVTYAVSEHVENAGVHSGDATIVLPPQRTYLETMRRILSITRDIAAALQITGPFNIQYLAKDNDVKVIECNLRASRSFPFVSKISGINFIDMATHVIMGHEVKNNAKSLLDLNYVGVKAPQFSFTRLEGADPTLGVEMVSTGEVGCLGNDFEEAFLKALLSVGFRYPVKNILLSTGPIKSKAAFLKNANQLLDLGIKLFATSGTAKFLEQHNIAATLLHWPLENKEPDTVQYISDGKIDLVINIPKNYQEEELTNDYIIRRKAVDYNIPVITNMQLARRFVETISRKKLGDLQIKSWREYN